MFLQTLVGFVAGFIWTLYISVPLLGIGAASLKTNIFIAAIVLLIVEMSVEKIYELVSVRDISDQSDLVKKEYDASCEICKLRQDFFCFFIGVFMSMFFWDLNHHASIKDAKSSNQRSNSVPVVSSPYVQNSLFTRASRR